MDSTRPTPSPRHLVEAYATSFVPGMHDLSSPAPQPTLSVPLFDDVDLAYPTVGGGLELREAIAERYQTLTAEDILVTSGASEALAACALACAALRVDVCADRGSYPSFTELFAITSDPACGHARQVRLLTNPRVPDGQRVDLDVELAQIREVGGFAIVDEVYRHIAIDGEVPAAAADLDALAVSIDDLSKPLGLGGLRIGWIATRNREFRDEARRWLALLTGGPSVLSEAAALVALRSFDVTVSMHTCRARSAAQAVYAALDAFGWTYERPQLGLTVAAYPPRPLDADAVTRLAATGCFLLDASLLGLDGAYRISLLAPPDDLHAALALLGRRRAQRAVVVLMRVPRVGFGKSRLAATIGPERAFELASAFLDDTLATTRDPEWVQVAAFTPASAVSEARSLAPGAVTVAQPDGDLGARIIAALDAGLQEAEAVVLVGSDTPDVPREAIERAFLVLADNDAVLGRAGDGGFYLIGVRATHAQMFRHVTWSTAAVYEQTRASLEQIGWRVGDVEPWSDVDDEASLLAFAERLEHSLVASHTRAVLDRLLKGAPR